MSQRGHILLKIFLLLEQELAKPRNAGMSHVANPLRLQDDVLAIALDSALGPSTQCVAMPSNDAALP